MIQYRHRNVPRNEDPATFAYDLPPPEAFFDLVTSGDREIHFNFGATFLHPKDQYTKSIGRDRALLDLQKGGHKKFTLSHVTVLDGRATFVLLVETLKGHVVFTVTQDCVEGWNRVETIHFV